MKRKPPSANCSRGASTKAAPRSAPIHNGSRRRTLSLTPPIGAYTAPRANCRPADAVRVSAFLMIREGLIGVIIVVMVVVVVITPLLVVVVVVIMAPPPI